MLCGILFAASAALLLLKLIKGPSAYDRLLAVNVLATNLALFAAVLGFTEKSPFYADISLVYALTGFIATIAFLKLFLMSKHA